MTDENDNGSGAAEEAQASRLERCEWASFGDDVMEGWGNQRVRVLRADGTVVYEGWMSGWVENPTGSLSLRRRTLLDADHPMNFEFKLVAAGQWESVETPGFVFDLPAIIDGERRAAEQAANQEAARRLGPGGAPVPLLPPGGNRAQRRQR